jgi:hypothetical protein
MSFFGNDQLPLDRHWGVIEYFNTILTVHIYFNTGHYHVKLFVHKQAIFGYNHAILNLKK